MSSVSQLLRAIFVVVLLGSTTSLAADLSGKEKPEVRDTVVLQLKQTVED